MYPATRSRPSHPRLLCLVLLCLVAWATHPSPAQTGEKTAGRAEKTAVLLVTFGTSVPEAQRPFQAIEQKEKEPLQQIGLARQAMRLGDLNDAPRRSSSGL
jgi:hypothetical protein